MDASCMIDGTEANVWLGMQKEGKDVKSRGLVFEAGANSAARFHDRPSAAPGSPITNSGPSSGGFNLFPPQQGPADGHRWRTTGTRSRRTATRPG